MSQLKEAEDYMDEQQYSNPEYTGPVRVSWYNIIIIIYNKAMINSSFWGGVWSICSTIQAISWDGDA